LPYFIFEATSREAFSHSLGHKPPMVAAESGRSTSAPSGTQPVLRSGNLRLRVRAERNVMFNQKHVGTAHTLSDLDPANKCTHILCT
jgi:hypothetical protein